MKITYKKAGVSYDELDAFKRLAQKEALKTSISTTRDVLESRGESAFVWEEKDCFRGSVIEGLGTKNLVADAMRAITGKTYYDNIAKDTVAMIVNDLIVVGATPQVINAYFAVGDSKWFADAKRVNDLVTGWSKACREAGVVWGGGETPTLKHIISKKSIDLAGSAIGIIKPKKNLVLGRAIEGGDAIILIESSGIHANGLSLARSVADSLEQGYGAKLENGLMFGEALLAPTHIYAGLVADLFKAGIHIHYMVNITGHGFRKLMRADFEFTYRISVIPPVPEIFAFIQKHSGLDDSEMYGTFNMGAGFALYIPAEDVRRVQQICKRRKLKSFVAGIVEKGKKQVIIESKNITYSRDTLRVRNDH